MARIGINPARGKYSDYRPARVTVAVLTYIPHLQGYFRWRLEVLRLCLTSLLAHTSPPYDLLVFDNGSCKPAVDYLHGLRESGSLRFLILSERNVGKIGAFKMIFQAAPGEIVAYSDDDIFFYPNWLEEHLKLMEAFPQAGMVSGVPVRNAATYATEAHQLLIREAPPGLSVRYERRIPDEWEVDWAVSTGRDPEEHLKAQEDRQDLVMRMGGVEAIAGANHFQFAAPKELISKALPEKWTGKLMGHMVELDHEVDRMGWLRLSTGNRFVRHIGNSINVELAAEARRFGLETEASSGPTPTPRQRRLLRVPGVRRVFLAVYDRLFRLLNET